MKLQNPYFMHGQDDSILETDIMRFMAIFGFCLMIIFAMVQSLPFVPQSEAPVIEDPVELQQRLMDLESTIQQLTRSLVNVEQQNQTLMQRLTGEQMKVRQLMGTLQQREQSLTQIRRKIQRRETIVAKLDQQLKSIARRRDKQNANAAQEKAFSCLENSDSDQSFDGWY